MDDREATALDPDEAYVSGNLSYPSIGDDEKDSPISLSLNPDVAGERRPKAVDKGRDPVGKSISQRRKNAHPSRRGIGGPGYGEGKAGSGARTPGSSAGTLPTPTTQLSHQINQLGLMSPLVSGGKRTLAERADDMSPMSDPEGGEGSHSLNDPGYDSLPHGPSSLEQPGSLQKERGQSGSGGSGAVVAEQEKDTHNPAVPERLQMEHRTRERSESPGVPPVAESVEVVTGPSAEAMMEAIPSLKRSAAGWERQRAKNPRLTEEGPTALQHRPIRVPTIVSPAQPNPRTSRNKSKRTGIGVSPERPGPSRSPLSSMEEGEPHGTLLSPSHQLGGGVAGGGGGGSGSGGSHVNFRSIEELSRSDRQPDMEVEQPNPQIAKVISLIRSSRENATFSGRHSPQSTRGASPTPSPLNSLQSSTCSVSPHSPRSPLVQPSSGGSGGGSVGAGVEMGRMGRLGVGGRGEGGEEEGEVKRQSALLQVSEAHLAILPDEDGDTPLHLSIIHENVRLTQYLVKLIVGVYMNLDIANNMRQTPLHLAIITRQPHIVQMLVQAGASVNFPDRKGNTALHLAAARRDIQVLQMLARATSPVPDFNCKNFAGLAPVHLATRESSIDVLKFLFQMGANKNAMDACSGRTSLHYAVEAENFILVNFLLENGCNVNSATFSGNTPLHIAAGRRLKEIVALLMAYGANPALANGEGDFPTDLPASLLMQRARMNAH